MFTIRFNMRSQGQYKSYTCRAYSVCHNPDRGEAIVTMEFPDGQYIEAVVGGPSEYSIAYVTNSESRTIDVVRELED